MKRKDHEEHEVIDRLEGGHWSPYERPRLSHGEKQLIAQQLQSQLRRQPMLKKSENKPFNMLASGVAFAALLVVVLGVWSAVLRPEINTAGSATEMPPTVPPPTNAGQVLPAVDSSSTMLPPTVPPIVTSIPANVTQEEETVTPSLPIGTPLPQTVPPPAAVLVNVPPTPISASSLDFDLVWPRLQSHFEAYNVEGAFVMYQQTENGRIRTNPIMSEERFTPASTFKILNALIGLESGVIPSAAYELEWDGTSYGIPAWEQDHSLRTAMQVSVVWYYQELARRVGAEQMEAFVSAADYGNREIAGEIDQFWLNGQLQISAVEQVAFLRRLYFNQLPFSAEHQESVKEMLLLEQTDSYVLYGKTGWGQPAEGEIGWFVGFVETADDVVFFATVIESDVPSADFRAARIDITRTILSEVLLIDLGG